MSFINDKYINVKGIFNSNSISNGINPMNVDGVLRIYMEDEVTAGCDGVLVYENGDMQKVDGTLINGEQFSFFALKDKPEVVKFDGLAKINNSYMIPSITIPQQIEFYEKVNLVKGVDANKEMKFGSDLVRRKTETGFAKNVGVDSLGYVNNILQNVGSVDKEQYDVLMGAFEESVKGTHAEFLSQELDSVEDYAWEIQPIIDEARENFEKNSTNKK